MELICDSFILGDKEARVFKGDVFEYLKGETALGYFSILCYILDGFIVVYDDLQLFFWSEPIASASFVPLLFGGTKTLFWLHSDST